MAQRADRRPRGGGRRRDAGEPGSGPDAPGLRERKKQRTRRAIEDVALARFAERGFDAVTVEEIAAAADVSPRTFFHYFPTKEDVVLADYGERLARIVEVLAGRPPGEPPLRAVRSAFLTVATDYEEARERLLPRFSVMAETPSVLARSLQLQAGWEDAVARTVAERAGVDGDDLEPRLLAGAALAAMRASLRTWLAAGGRPRLPDLVAECFDRLERGLGGEPR